MVNTLAGCFSHRKTEIKSYQHFFWPGIAADIRAYYRSCDKWQPMSARGRVRHVPLQSLPVITVVAINFIGPLSPPFSKELIASTVSVVEEQSSDASSTELPITIDKKQDSASLGMREINSSFHWEQRAYELPECVLCHGKLYFNDSARHRSPYHRQNPS